MVIIGSHNWCLETTRRIREQERQKSDNWSGTERRRCSRRRVIVTLSERDGVSDWKSARDAGSDDHGQLPAHGDLCGLQWSILELLRGRRHLWQQSRAQLELRAMGTLQVHLNGEQLSCSPQCAALLLYLVDLGAIEPRRFNQIHWQDGESKALESTLYRARQLIGRQHIMRGEKLSINPQLSARSDAAAFERELRHAIEAASRGESAAVPNYAVYAPGRDERWIEDRRQELEALHEKAVQAQGRLTDQVPRRSVG